MPPPSWQPRRRPAAVRHGSGVQERAGGESVCVRPCRPLEDDAEASASNPFVFSFFFYFPLFSFLFPLPTLLVTYPTLRTHILLLLLYYIYT